VNLTFISTGVNAPTKRLCLASVEAQTVKCRHVYVESDPSVTVTQNWYREIMKLPATEIVALLDGDDWLAHERVAEQVIAMHETGALVTYGNYIASDGESGVCAPYARGDYRREPWRASHLKTFRASLFHKLDEADLQIDGKWLDVAADVAVMLPLLELAGEHVLFCKDVLYVYHRASSFEASASPEERNREKAAEAAVRAKARRA
jgi:hypothetical protein